MKPTEIREPDHEPTVAGIAGYLARCGVDRGSCVWTPNDGPPSLCIFLLSKNAVRDIHPLIADFIGKHWNRSPAFQLSADLTTPVMTIFKAMRETRDEFLFIRCDLGAIYLFQTPHIDEWFAEQLTARGCVTNLT